jgi:hypothetical protein
LGTGTAYFSLAVLYKLLRDIIERFRAEGNIYSNERITGNDGSGQAGGAFGQIAHDASVSLGYGTKSEKTAVTLLHELIHVAGARYAGSQRLSYYSDAAMAAAWNKIGVIITPQEYRRRYPDIVEVFRASSNGSDYVASRLSGAAHKIVCSGFKTDVSTLP